MPQTTSFVSQDFELDLTSSSTFPATFGSTGNLGFAVAPTAPNPRFPTWMQAYGAGTVTVIWEDGTSETLTVSGGEVLPGTVKTITSMTVTRLRVGASALLPSAVPFAGGAWPSYTRAAILALSLPATSLTVYDTTNNIVTTNTGTPAAPIWSRVTGGPNVTASTAGGQSIPSAAPTVVTGWTASTNIGGAFNASTGVFTAPVAGFYEFEAQCQWAATATAVATEFRVALAVNGVVQEQGVNSTHTAASVVKQTPNIEMSVYLAAGALVTVSAFQNSGSAIVLTADATTNFFCAEYVQ